MALEVEVAVASVVGVELRWPQPESATTNATNPRTLASVAGQPGGGMLQPYTMSSVVILPPFRSVQFCP